MPSKKQKRKQKRIEEAVESLSVIEEEKEATKTSKEDKGEKEKPTKGKAKENPEPSEPGEESGTLMKALKASIRGFKASTTRHKTSLLSIVNNYGKFELKDLKAKAISIANTRTKMMRTYSELLELVENQELVKYTAEADNYESMLSEMSQTIAEIIKWSTSSQNRRSATPKLSWETTLQGLDTTFEDLESEDDDEDPRKATKLSLSQQVDKEGIPDGATGNVTSTPKSKQTNANAAPYDPAQLFRRPDTSGLPADQQDFVKSVYQTQMRLLPQLKLSRFSGSKSDHFDTWFCHFQTLVESQAVLGNKAKYLYLLECIEGTAKELVLSTTAGLIEEDSYEMALNTLTKCFGGPTQSTLQIITKFHELTPLTTRSRMEISRVYVCFKGIQNYHKKKENHHELEEISSSLLIKGREKIGRFIREFDAWRLDNALPHSFNSLVRWLERMQEAAQDAFIFSGHSYDQKPRKERNSQKMSNNSNNAKTQQGIIGRKEEKEENFECSTGCNFKRFHKLPWPNKKSWNPSLEYFWNMGKNIPKLFQITKKMKEMESIWSTKCLGFQKNCCLEYEKCFDSNCTAKFKTPKIGYLFLEYKWNQKISNISHIFQIVLQKGTLKILQFNSILDTSHTSIVLQKNGIYVESVLETYSKIGIRNYFNYIPNGLHTDSNQIPKLELNWSTVRDSSSRDPFPIIQSRVGSDSSHIPTGFQPDSKVGIELEYSTGQFIQRSFPHYSK